MIALFVGGFLFEVRAGGLAPSLWLDTFSEYSAAVTCARDGMCSTLGLGTSFRGLRFGVTWPRLLALADSLGLGLVEVFLILHCLGALAFVLTGAAAYRR